MLQECKMHCCYLITTEKRDRIYIGYTVDFERRLRQHNGEITGGAKKTSKYRPWYPLVLISGFEDNHQALRFEYRLQKAARRSHKIERHLDNINTLIKSGDGSWKAGTKRPWPQLYVLHY